MPEYLAPGVYVEEMSIQPKPIEGVPTSTIGFIGPSHKGPIKRSTLVTNLAEFERTYGSGRRLRLDDGALRPNYTWHAVRAWVDLARGVSKAPANEFVTLAVGLDQNVTEASLTVLNAESINCIRAFGPRDFRVWGGRTLSADPEWKYVNVSRLSIYLEASIDKGTQWAVFGPNAEPLWAKIRRAVEAFLTSEWRSGSLPGSRPEEAFFVKCDRSTMTQADIDLGRLICVVGVAVVRPAEFVLFRIGQWTADRPPPHPKRRRSVRRGAG